MVALVFNISGWSAAVQEIHLICRCIIQSRTHQTDGGKEQEYRRILSACTPMSADSHVLPFPVCCLEIKTLTTTDQPGMKKPPAVTELIDNAASGCSSVTSFPSTPQLTRIWLVSAPVNNQATINRAINSYCNTLIYSITQGSSVITSSIYINTIYTHTRARARSAYSTNMHTGDATVTLNCTDTHSCV